MPPEYTRALLRADVTACAICRDMRDFRACARGCRNSRPSKLPMLMSDTPLLIRLAEDDDDFILALVPRFVDFTLPPWRRRHECIEGIRKDLSQHLDDQPPNNFLFVAEDADGERVGFIELQKTLDFFTGRSNCHVNNVAVSPAHEGRGVARALMAHAEAWALEHHCALVTLAVFPGNERARALYEACGYATDLLRLVKPVR
jgi:ribosomal protein S18 acetylase RimI-like enzyme